MRRFLRIRLVLVLFALILAPAAVLPFAERLRDEWTKFWEPEPIEPDWLILLQESPTFTNAIYVCPTDWSAAAAVGQQPADEALPVVVIEPARPVENNGDLVPWSETSSDAPSNAVER